MACEVLKCSPCQYVYCCCIECLPASKLVEFFDVLGIVVFRKGPMELRKFYVSTDSRICSLQKIQISVYEDAPHNLK
jgi:hypothetical protein